MNVGPRSTWQTNAKSALIELPRVDPRGWTIQWAKVERRVQAKAKAKEKVVANKSAMDLVCGLEMEIMEEFGFPPKLSGKVHKEVSRTLHFISTSILGTLQAKGVQAGWANQAMHFRTQRGRVTLDIRTLGVCQDSRCPCAARSLEMPPTRTVPSTVPLIPAAVVISAMNKLAGVKHQVGTKQSMQVSQT